MQCCNLNLDWPQGLCPHCRRLSLFQRRHPKVPFTQTLRDASLIPPSSSSSALFSKNGGYENLFSISSLRVLIQSFSSLPTTCRKKTAERKNILNKVFNWFLISGEKRRVILFCRIDKEMFLLLIWECCCYLFVVKKVKGY